MPDTAAQKRPNIASRHSSGSSTVLSRSPADPLSSSGQRTRSQRHIVGARGRVPSYSRGSKQLQKVSAQDEDIAIGGQKQPNIKRNISNVHIARNHSSTALRKNHSETSLKRNKSGAQLAPLAKLTRPGSSRQLSRNSKGAKQKRWSLQSAKGATDQLTVRFDLGGEAEDGEEAWEEASQSNPSTKPNTRRNSLSSEQQPQDTAGIQPGQDARIPKPEPVKPDRIQIQQPQEAQAELTPHTPPPQTPTSPDQKEMLAKSADTVQPIIDAIEEGRRRARPNSRISDRYSITDRLLKRNVSFTAAPPPEVSSVSASVSASGSGSSHASPTNTRQSIHNNSEIVSRFLNGISSSGAARSSYLAQHQLEMAHEIASSEEEQLRKNRSTPSFPRMPSRTSSSLSGSATPTTSWQDNMPTSTKSSPRAGSRRVRLSAEAIPTFGTAADHEYHSGQEADLSAQSDTEYRRVRLFYNPLGDAIGRLQEHLMPKAQARPAQRSNSKPNLLTSNSNEGKSYLSTSLRSQRSAKSVKETPAESSKSRPKVSFQGLQSAEDKEGMAARAGDAERNKGSPNDEVHEIIKRLWNRHQFLQAENMED